MISKKLIPISILGVFGLISCTSSNNSKRNTGGTAQGISSTSVSALTTTDITGEFTLMSSDGSYTKTGNIYKITKGGTYTANGFLSEGQILVNAGGDDNVEIDLSNAKITNSSDSPIKALSGNKLEIKSKGESYNQIVDSRSEKTADNASVGEGAISSKIDLFFTGSGTLDVSGSYCNAIHSTKDVSIKNTTIQATGVNNAIKGKDSISITSGDLRLYASKGQGLKTDNSDVSSSGKQRGTITISGGSLYIDTCFDAIDASYNALIDELDNETSTSIFIKTGKNSSYASNYSSSSSAKGIKAANEILINAGALTLSASDDALHANYGTTLGNGSKGVGNITVAGGSIGVASGDDGIHADNTISVTGGKIEVTNATEGFEANHVNISGGQTYIYGTDDGINASRKINEVATVNISGGFVDISVNGNDVDGIDSNGNFTQTGGVVISRGSIGSTSGMSTGLDCDGTASIIGGTFIAFNGVESSPTRSSGVLYAGTFSEGSSEGIPGGGPGGGGGPHRDNLEKMNANYASGTYILKGGDMLINFSNLYEYSSFCIYSDLLKTNTSYTLSKDGSTILDWTQGSESYVIS